jgi:hypothetical protein
MIFELNRGPVSLLKAGHGPRLKESNLLIVSLPRRGLPLESRGVTEPLLSSTLKACLQRMQ